MIAIERLYPRQEQLGPAGASAHGVIAGPRRSCTASIDPPYTAARVAWDLLTDFSPWRSRRRATPTRPLFTPTEPGGRTATKLGGGRLRRQVPRAALRDRRCRFQGGARHQAPRRPREGAGAREPSACAGQQNLRQRIARRHMRHQRDRGALWRCEHVEHHLLITGGSEQPGPTARLSSGAPVLAAPLLAGPGAESLRRGQHALEIKHGSLSGQLALDASEFCPWRHDRQFAARILVHRRKDRSDACSARPIASARCRRQGTSETLQARCSAGLREQRSERQSGARVSNSTRAALSLTGRPSRS